MATLAEFKISFPEFARSNGDNDALIQAKLNEASDVTDPAIYGSLTDQAIMYRAADDLANSPNGRAMKLINRDGSTQYSRRLRELIRANAIGIRAL